MITGCFKDMIEDLALLLASSTAVKRSVCVCVCVCV